MSAGVPGRLLAARREAELLAAPEDPRQYYAVARWQKALDESLALALDETLVGSDESLHQAQMRLDALLSDGQEGYREASRASDIVLQALQARDRALAEAMYFIRWQVRRGRYDQAARGGRDVTTLVSGALELAKRLDEISQNGLAGPGQMADADQLGDLTERVEAARTDLAQLHADRIAAATFEEGGSLTDMAVEIPELLRCALGFGGGRTGLHQAWIERITGKTGAQPAQAPVPARDAAERLAAEQLAYLRWVAADGVAPLVRLLEEKPDQAGVASDARAPSHHSIDGESKRSDIERALAALGGRIRLRLSQLTNDCNQLSAGAQKLLTERPAAEARLGYSEADVICRSLGALAGDGLRFQRGASPTDRLRKLDLHAWLLGQGQRALDDCWGFWQDGATSDSPYFVRVATFVLDNAPEALFDSAALRQRMWELEAVVRDWEPLAAEDLPVVDEGGGFKRHALAFRSAEQMRPGEAAVFLTDANGALFPTYTSESRQVRRVAAPVREDSQLVNRLDVEALGNVPVLEATALFRGHVRLAEFSIGRGVLVEWQKPAARDATVVVRGDSKQISQIVFIFDCSGSMTRGGKDRVNDARGVLARILDRLLEQGEQFRVALVVYGRRAWWIEGDAKPHHLPGSPFQGPPHEDVEAPFHMTPLDKNLVIGINEFLKNAEAKGVTPLYYALNVALQEFDRGVQGSRHIIAITDGVDDLSVTSPPKDAKFKRATVIAGLNALPTRIDVIEFAVNDADLKERERAIFPAGRKALDELARSPNSGGSWISAENAAVLEQALLDSLRLDRFRVQPASESEPVQPDYTELGTAAIVPAPPKPAEYLVHMQSHDAPPAKVTIEDGEALELVYRRTPVNHLVHPIYQTPDERDVQAADGYRIASHMPKLEAGDPEFRISIQSGDEDAFSRRPDVIWASVAPLDEPNGRKYFFVDRSFLPGLPIPMLGLPARRWPGSKFARVELAIAPNAAALNAVTIAVAPRGAEEHQAFGATLRTRMTEIPGRGYEIVVDEQHPPDSQDFPLHVELVPPPDSVSRTYFEASRAAHYVFRYAIDRPEPTLRVLTRREIERGGRRVVFERVELPGP
jgi:hypothetical protein